MSAGPQCDPTCTVDCGRCKGAPVTDGTRPEPVEGELLPAPDPRRVFSLGYSVGRSSVEAEAAAVRVFARARRRRLVREATAVGVAWLVGSALGEWIR